MKERLTIALVAHDHRKADMVDWVTFNAEYLSKHHLVCTGTRDEDVMEALKRKENVQDFVMESLKARIRKIREEAGK